MDYDGLTLDQALGLCAMRHGDLSGGETKFVKAMAARKKPPTPPQALRLAAMVARLRQGSLLADGPLPATASYGDADH
jgi:hypothetical protein